MKISLPKNTLQDALQNLSKATPGRSTVPILNSILFEAKDDTLILRATDLEITMVMREKAKVMNSGGVAVPHRVLMETTNAMPETELTIEADEKQRVTIDTDFGSYDISGSPGEEFPAVPEVDEKKDVIIASKTLERLIGKTIFALSSDELKPALMGALFEFGDDSVTAVATDGHRLSICSRSDASSGGYRGEIIVPKKFLQLVLQHMSEEEETVLWVGENHVTVSFGDLTIFTRIIDERYPDYRTVLPQDQDKIVKAEREPLLAAVRRVAIFSNRSTRQISLTLSAGENAISTEDPERASSAKEKIDLEYEGDDLLIGYNAAYLGDLLSHLDTDRVIMKLKSPVSAGLIVPETQVENEELTMLLMPMRTTAQ